MTYAVMEYFVGVFCIAIILLLTTTLLDKANNFSNKIDKEIDINKKYLSACNCAIREKERQLGRCLTGEEQQEIFTRIKKDFY